MITNGFAYVAFLFCFAGVVATLEMKYKDTTFFKYVPTPVVLYVMCMVFATFDLWEKTDSVNAAYSVVRGNLIPAMIFVMLLRCDIRKILKLGPRMLLGFFSATITIMIGFVVMFALMKNGFPPESWKTWGALAGSWIGGTANMVAIQGALGISDSAMGYTLLVDNVNYSIWVILLLATVPYAKFFNKWTKTDTSTIDSVGLMLSEVKENARTKMETADLALLIGAGLAVSAISAWLASYISPMLMDIFGKSDFLSVSTVTIILATIFGILCAMTPMNSIPGSSPVSMTMLYIIICLIASRASFKELTDAPYYLAAGFVGDALAERHPADRFVLHRVAHAPVDIAVPDIARVLFRALLVRIQPGDHCAHQAQLNREVQLVEQLILGGEIAKQRPLGNPRAAGYGRR